MKKTKSVSFQVCSIWVAKAEMIQQDGWKLILQLMLFFHEQADGENLKPFFINWYSSTKDMPKQTLTLAKYELAVPFEQSLEERDSN